MTFGVVRGVEAGREDVRIELGDTASFAGLVVDAAGDPVEGALVVIAPEDAPPMMRASCTRDASSRRDGRFGFASVCGTRFTVRVSSSANRSAGFPEVVSGGVPADGDAFVVRVGEGLAIAGTVYDTGGAPCAARVEIRGTTPCTVNAGEDGRFRIAGLPDGDHELVATGEAGTVRAMVPAGSESVRLRLREE
jgi:hypothetical protein